MKRTFLSGFFVSLFLLLSLSSFSDIILPASAQDAASDKLEVEIKAFEKKYGVKLSLAGHKFEPEVNRISGVDSNKVDAYLPLFLSEFNLYPPEFTRKCGLKKIVFCKQLAYAGQFRAGIPGYQAEGIMFYDVERGSYSPSYQRHTVHHEFFHLFDLKDDGKVYKDTLWAGLNDPKFKYGDGGVSVQNDTSQGLITFKRPGFLNKYSTSGVEEDKAELFTYMVTRAEMVEERSKVDPILMSKMLQTKRLVRNFSASMDESFWKQASKLDRQSIMKADDYTAKIRAEAKLLVPLAKSDVGRAFLAAADHLPWIENSLALNDPTNQNRFVFSPEFTFFKALDLVGHAGLESLDGKKVVHFGFSTIGHFRLMAACGAHTHGVVEELDLKRLYGQPGDQGKVAVAEPANSKNSFGSVRLSFGKFPADEKIAQELGDGIDLFIAKNNLKKGLLHPAQKVEPDQMISLGVSDQAFIESVFDRLNSGGYFMIFNMHFRRTEPGDEYNPRSDARCPFSKSDLQDAGFKILEFDKDDTKFVHEIAKALGWDEHLDLEEQCRATWTLMKKE